MDSIDGRKICVRVAATPAACPECLVPKAVLIELIAGAVTEKLPGEARVGVELAYPNEWGPFRHGTVSF